MGQMVDPDIQDPATTSAQPPSLSLWLQKGEHITLTNRAFHVSDDGTTRIVHEFYPHLRALSLRTCPAQNLGKSIAQIFH